MVSTRFLSLPILVTLGVSVAFTPVSPASAAEPQVKKPAIERAKKKPKKPAASRLPLCMNDAGRLFVSSTGRCPANAFEATVDDFAGAGDDFDDDPEEPGNSASDHLYGDGSSGDLVVSSAMSLEESSTQYENIIIQPGAVLTVSSGTVLRCTGTFSNQGTIVVSGFSEGAIRDISNASTIAPALRQADPGNGAGIAGNGEVGTGSNDVLNGRPARALALGEASQLIRPGIKGGAGGGAGMGSGGVGGGVLVVLCKGAVTNDGAGAIHADGQSAPATFGGGGGAGGIVILASKTSVLNTGAITARGGAGGSAATNVGAGGGGGGGIIHAIAPDVDTGNTALDGGAAGDNDSITINVSRRAGGGAGGSLGGAGGAGAKVLSGSKPAEEAEDGLDGQVIETFADPGTLF